MKETTVRYLVGLATGSVSVLPVLFTVSGDFWYDASRVVVRLIAYGGLAFILMWIVKKTFEMKNNTKAVMLQ